MNTTGGVIRNNNKNNVISATDENDASTDHHVVVQTALLPVAGNWFGDNDGFDGIGVYDVTTAMFQLKANLSDGPPDVSFRFGPIDPTARPIAGDWEGTGVTGVGVYFGSTGTVLLRLDERRNVSYLFGPPGNDWWPVASDWTGGGKASIGLFDRETSMFYLRYVNAAGPADTQFQFGAPSQGAYPVAGSWDGATAAHSGIGIFVGTGFFELKHNLTGGAADLGYSMSVPGSEYDTEVQKPSPWLPVAGRWRPSRCRKFDDGTSLSDPPTWADGAVFYQLRIELFTTEGTFDAAIPHLSYVASLGVTCIVLLPVAEARVPGQPVTPRTIFYGVLRPDVIDATLGGGAGLARFVSACHALGMKVRCLQRHDPFQSQFWIVLSTTISSLCNI